jgi:hypothetical protein
METGQRRMDLVEFLAITRALGADPLNLFCRNLPVDTALKRARTARFALSRQRLLNLPVATILSDCSMPSRRQGEVDHATRTPQKGRRKRGAAHPVKGNGNGANLGFEAQMFLAADKLRKNLEPSDYKHVALGLIFLKHISNAFEAKRADLLAEDPAAAEDPDE